MSNNPFGGTMADLLAAAEERRRADEAHAKHPQIERSPVERPNGTFGNVPLGRSGLERSTPERSPVERFTPKSGYTKVPNTVLDSVLPILDPREQVVFIRLYRLSWGWGEAECTVSVPTLASATKVSRTQMFRVLARLEELKLIERVRAGRGRQEGTRYRVVKFEDEELERSESERSRAERSDSERPKLGPIKERRDLKKDIKAAHVAVAPALDSFSVYDVRRIAARFRELHHGEAGYTRDRLRADIHTTLIGEGREPDDKIIDEAIGN
jgi:hypothetical protein